MILNENSYIQRAYQVGWHDLVNLLFKEFTGNHESEEQGLSRLRDIGASLAKLYSIEQKKTISTLEESINRILETFDWGFIRIAPAPKELIIIHCGWPHTITESDDGRWRFASAAVLEGLYSQWLVEQGADKETAFTWKDDSTEDVLIFRYALQPK